MSDSSPRWPGSNGAPGLDFSPRPRESAPGDGPTDQAARVNGSKEQTASAPTPTRSADAPQTGQDPKVQESAASWAWQPLGAAPDATPPASSATSAGAGDGATTIRPAAGAAGTSSSAASASGGSGAWGSGGGGSAAGGSAAGVSTSGGSTAGGSAPSHPGSAAAAAAAGGAISGAAARAASQSKQAATARRTTPSPATSTPSAAATRRTGTRRTRKARLRLARLDPWSVMKTTFLFSIAFGIILMVVAWVLWTVLAGSGALESLNQFMTTLIGQEGEEFNVEHYVNGPRVLGAAAVLAAIDIVILTAVATLFAFLYNLAATVIGGLEVTLAED